MATIVTKNSSTASAVPTTSDLVQGELAVNVTDKRLFTENASTQIVELGTNPSTITTATATVTGTLTANGTFASSNAVLTGGTVNGVVIGGTTPQAITGTTVTANTGFVGGLTGNVTGNLTGNVTGNVTGDLTGDVTGNLTASTGTTTLNNLVVNGTADFTNTKLVNVTTPVAGTDAANKDYVDTSVAAVIDAAPAALDTLNELAAALGDDANFSSTITTSIATKLPLAGGTMTGAIEMGTSKITGLGDPTANQDAATKNYVDTQDATKLSTTGGTMSGAIAMGTNKITGVGDPTLAQDVATKAYTDSILGSATSAADSAAAAATSASNAATSASNAASSATTASNAVTSAELAATNAAASYDSFDDRYLGAKASDPAVDNDGDALIAGATYFNTATDSMKVYSGSAWSDVAPVATTVTLSQVTDFPSQSGQSGKYLSTNGTTPSWETLTTDPTLGTLTKTFTQGEASTIDLTSSVLAPVVSVTKEVPQSGVTNNNWDVNSTTENYTRLDSAYATTLTPSSTGDGTFTLGTGSFAAEDVGKTIYGNSGVAFITATDGSYVTTTDFADTSAISSGSWEMYGVVYNAADGDLELSSVLTNGFDVSTASYSQSFSVASEETNPYGLAFNTNGTKMFIIGLTGDDVNEYTLSTTFDISTASYSQSFSVASEETNPTGITFNDNGTKMFVVGDVGDSVYEYNLSTSFDISSASYAQNFSLSSQTAFPAGIAFNTDGTKMFVSSGNQATISEYELSTGFNVATAAYSQNFSVSSQESFPRGVIFNTNGTKMFVVGSSGDDVNEYSLSTGFDVSTASFVASFSVSAQDTGPTGIAFDTTGNKMFIVGFSSDSVYEYSTGTTTFPTGYHPVHTTASIDSTYWTDINSMTADQAAGDGNVYYAISTDDRTTWTVIDNTDGERDIVRNNAGTWQYNSNATYALETWANATTNTELAALAEAMEGAVSTIGFGLSAVSYSQSLSVSGQDGTPLGIKFNPTGTKMFVVGADGQDVNEYTLSTGFDVSTASFVDSFSTSSQTTQPRSVAFNTTGTKMFVTGGGVVYEYTLSTGFDVSTATYSQNFTSNSGAEDLVFNSDGTKLFISHASAQTIGEYTLSTGFDVSTASFVDSFSVAAQAGNPRGLSLSTNGLLMFVQDLTNDSVYEYTLSTAFDVSTASYSNSSVSVASQDATPTGMTFSSNGLKMYVVGVSGDSVYEYAAGTSSYTNQMDKTQLDAVTDPNHIALGDDLDLSIIFNMTSGTTVPSSDGVAINYDANVLNKGAVLGTDYDFDAPAGDKARITALTAGNFKVRVV